MAARAGPVMPPGLQTKCDGQPEQIWPQLQADEEGYLQEHGIHWQGLATHSAVPENGADVLPDVGTLAPSDQPAPWPTTYLQTPRTIAVTVDVYVGPAGQGYVLTATCQTTPPVVPTQAAHRWQRALAVCPEAEHFAHDWVAVDPAPLPGA
jgi:hypothetical protein